MATILSTGVYAYEHARPFFAVSLPGAETLDVWRVPFEPDALLVTVGGHGIAAPWHTTAEERLTSNVPWRRVHVKDWNGMPRPLREQTLDSMLLQYRHVLMPPAVWDGMTSHDWDHVPQPLPTVAFR